MYVYILYIYIYVCITCSPFYSSSQAPRRCPKCPQSSCKTFRRGAALPVPRMPRPFSTVFRTQLDAVLFLADHSPFQSDHVFFCPVRPFGKGIAFPSKRTLRDRPNVALKKEQKTLVKRLCRVLVGPCEESADGQSSPGTIG